MTHSKFSPSAAHRWFLCPGSVSASEGIVDIPSSFAEEGTLAHKLAETCLTLGLSAEECAEFEKGVYPEEMAPYVQQFLNLVNSYRTEKDILHVEKVVNYEKFAPGGFGTCDAIVVPQGNEAVHIFDFKYGKGNYVFAHNNLQLMIYALGTRQSVPGCRYADVYHLHIVQPRINNTNCYTVYAGKLEEFGRILSEKVKAVQETPEKRIPNPIACKWCPAKGSCSEYVEYVKRGVMEAFKAMGEPEELKACTEQIVKKRLLDMKDEILAYLKQLEKDIVQEILSGKPFEGYKVVEGRKNRKWKEHTLPILEELLGDKAYTKKSVSVSEAEKLLGNKKIQELTEKEKGGPVLVPESDRRRPYEEMLMETFFKIPEH